MSETQPMQEPAGSWGVRRGRILLACFIAYVAVLGVFTVNEVFRLDLFEWEVFTPELHTWVYSLLHHLEKDPEDPALWRTEADLERNLGALRDLLARTRYSRVAAPGSLEDELARYLERSAPGEPLEARRSRAKDFFRRGRDAARARLGEIGDWVTMPILVRYLDHEDPRMRREVFDLLKSAAGEFCSEPGKDQWKANGFGYDPGAPKLARDEAIRRWKDWLRGLDLP